MARPHILGQPQTQLVKTGVAHDRHANADAESLLSKGASTMSSAIQNFKSAFIAELFENITKLAMAGMLAVMLYFSYHSFETQNESRQAQLDDSRYTRMMVSILTSEAIIACDQDGKVSVFNPSAEFMFGYSSNEVIGQSINMLMQKSDVPKHDVAMKDALSRLMNGPDNSFHLPINRQIPVVTKAGKVKIVESTVRGSFSISEGIKSALFIVVLREVGAGTGRTVDSYDKANSIEWFNTNGQVKLLSKDFTQ